MRLASATPGRVVAHRQGRRMSAALMLGERQEKEIEQ